MRHAGEVVRRTAILEHVWDYNYDGLSNVVDVYVGYLRRKLEHARRPGPDPDRPGRRLRPRAGVAAWPAGSPGCPSGPG